MERLFKLRGSFCSISRTDPPVGKYRAKLWPVHVRSDLLRTIYETTSLSRRYSPGPPSATHSACIKYSCGEICVSGVRGRYLTFRGAFESEGILLGWVSLNESQTDDCVCFRSRGGKLSGTVNGWQKCFNQFLERLFERSSREEVEKVKLEKVNTIFGIGEVQCVLKIFADFVINSLSVPYKSGFWHFLNPYRWNKFEEEKLNSSDWRQVLILILYSSVRRCISKVQLCHFFYFFK